VQRGLRFASIILLSASLSGCHHEAIDRNVPASVALTSPGFQSGQAIPARYTCHGANVSPALSWDALPSRTRSLTLIVIDQDALFGGYVHWVLYNLPPQPNTLPEDLPRQEALPNGTRQGPNGSGSPGYTGPCPPGKSAHHYVFTLYALNDTLAPHAGAGKSEILKAMQGHILAEGKLTGSYQRP
jgi:Raf kinase inhibitor-like YbhB/YbcL family protein